jgi:hypothetical protein
MSGFAAKNRFPMKRVSAGLLAGKKDRTHLHSFGTESERCGDAASVGYTACRDDGDSYGINCLRDE